MRLSSYISYRFLLTALLCLCLMGHALARATSPTLAVVGDSLSAGYNIPAEQGWVSLLAQRLQTSSADNWQVINASITGDTSRGGLARLPRLLEQQQPQIVVIELGGNDGLRGFRIAQTEANLDRMMTLSRTAGAQVVLVGIKLPANYGKRYGEQFHAMYARLAKKHATPLVDFLLEGVALKPELMQADGIHPNAAAQAILLDNVWPALQPLLTGAAE